MSQSYCTMDNASPELHVPGLCVMKIAFSPAVHNAEEVLDLLAHTIRRSESLSGIDAIRD